MLAHQMNIALQVIQVLKHVLLNGEQVVLHVQVLLVLHVVQVLKEMVQDVLNVQVQHGLAEVQQLHAVHVLIVMLAIIQTVNVLHVMLITNYLEQVVLHVHQMNIALQGTLVLKAAVPSIPHAQAVILQGVQDVTLQAVIN